MASVNYTVTQDKGIYAVKVATSVEGVNVFSFATYSGKSLEIALARITRIDGRNQMAAKHCAEEVSKRPDQTYHLGEGKGHKESLEEFVARRKSEGATKEEIRQEMEELLD